MRARRRRRIAFDKGNTLVIKFLDFVLKDVLLLKNDKYKGFKTKIL